MKSKQPTARNVSRAWSVLPRFVPVLVIALASCAGGGGGGGGGGGVSLPDDDGTLLPTVGLTSVAVGDTVAQVRWTSLDADGNPVPVALFAGASRSTVHQGAPLVASLSGNSRTLTGLTNGQDLYLGLAVDQGGGNYAPAGALLRVTPRAPVFVDVNSTAQNPDGRTPAGAFPDVISGALTAFSDGGGNVWVAEGSYPNTSVLLFPGVDLYGGFEPGFTLAQRDPATRTSRLVAQPNKAVLEIQGGAAGSVVDGFEVDGNSTAVFGVDVDQTDAELRWVDVHDCAGRGLRLRSVSTTNETNVRLTRVRSFANGAEGLSLSGPFDLFVDGSRFSSNALEGLDLDGLIAPEGVPVSCIVRGSVFSGNGFEGLDCDLVPPLTTGPGGGFYDVLIEGSRFELNGFRGGATSSEGLKVDVDFELISGWRADIVVRGCTARANRGAGVLLDLDSTSAVLVHRLSSVGNGGAGLMVSSESTPGLASVTSSAFEGNRGAGIRAQGGNVPVVVSHCVIAGNLGGGLVSPQVRSTASSTVAWQQPNPWSNAEEHFDVQVASPAASPFANAPRDYLSVTGFDGVDLTLANAGPLAPGDTVELSGDGQARTVTAVQGARVTVTPAPAELQTPALLTAFSGGSVDEDYALAAGSPAIAAGMPTAAGAPRDAGLFGSAAAGEPGREDAAPVTLFFGSAITPPATTLLAAGSELLVELTGGSLDPAMVGTSTVQVVDGFSVPLTPSGISEQAGRVRVQAPAGGWPPGFITLRLYEGLHSAAGTPLAMPVAVTLQVQ